MPGLSRAVYDPYVCHKTLVSVLMCPIDAALPLLGEIRPDEAEHWARIEFDMSVRGLQSNGEASRAILHA